MKEFGKVLEILSKTHLLLKLTVNAEPNQILTVFAQLPVPDLEKKYGLSSLHFPKGQVRVLSKQSENLYLAESFREKKHRAIGTDFGLLAGLMATQELSPPSAHLAEPTAPVHIQFEKTVQVGDIVGDT